MYGFVLVLTIICGVFTIVSMAIAISSFLDGEPLDGTFASLFVVSFALLSFYCFYEYFHRNSPKELEAKQVQIDTTYTIINNKVDTTYVVKYIE